MKVLHNLSEVNSVLDLMEIAIKIDMDHPLLVKWPFEAQPREICFSSFSSQVGSYNSNNEILSFVINNAQYTIPCFEKAWRALYKTHLRIDSSLYCPLSYMGEYPIAYKNYWENLKNAALLQRRIDFYADCKKYSKCLKIKKLDDAILKNCIEIPENGIKPIKYSAYTIYPLLITPNGSKELIGHYNNNYYNNFSVFVHYDGKTYYSFDLKVTEALEKCYIKDTTIIIPGLTFQKE